jgi:hypothetical protein
MGLLVFMRELQPDLVRDSQHQNHAHVVLLSQEDHVDLAFE